MCTNPVHTPYQSRLAIASHPVPLTTYPDDDLATYYRPPSAYLPVPQQQFGRTYRDSIRSTSPSVPSTLSVRASRIRDWDDDADESDNPSEDSVHSTAQCFHSSSRRSEKRDDRDRKRGDNKSRHGSVYSPSHRDRRSNAGFRVGPSWDLSPSWFVWGLLYR